MKKTLKTLAVKPVNANGQRHIGKQHAAHEVVVNEAGAGPGIITIRTATPIPDNERWLHEPAVAAKLQTAMRRAAVTPPSDRGTDEILQRLIDGDRQT